MLQLFLILLPFLAVALFLLAIVIVVKKNGTFRSEDVGQNKAMRDRGIHCYRTQDRVEQARPSIAPEMMN
jgi:hypothetical protein